MDTQNRFLIVITDGVFDHAELRDKDSNLAPLDLTELAAVAPDINAASLARIAELETELAESQGSYAALDAFKTAMEERVSAVLQSGDPAQYEALATDFLTPAQEKANAEKLAKATALEAEAAAIRASLTE